VVLTSSTTFTYTFTGTVTLGGPIVPAPSLTPGGVVPVFSDNSIIQPGSWVSVFGSNMVSTTSTWNGDFPTSLGGVTVSINGKLAYLWFVSPGQINLQVPDDTKTGCVPVVVNAPGGQLTTQVQLAPYGPAFSLLDGKYVAAIILTPNGGGAYGGGTYDIAGPVGRFPYATRPAKRGENVVLYGVGFGPTNPPVPAGKLFSGSARTTGNVAMGLVDSQGRPTGLTPSFVGLVSAGLFQLNITIPQNAPTGDALLQASVGNFQAGPNSGGATSNGVKVYLPIQ
jgi:uncharacterized protein (TIGR03437 family)